MGRDLALDAAGAAVVGAGRQRALAAVARIAVAVGEARRARERAGVPAPGAGRAAGAVAPALRGRYRRKQNADSRGFHRSSPAQGFKWTTGSPETHISSSVASPSRTSMG